MQSRASGQIQVCLHDLIQPYEVISLGISYTRDYEASFDFPAIFCYPEVMNNVDFDKPLNQYIFECCINCGRFTRTKNKERLILFMMDHYGVDGIKRCKDTWYGEYVWNIFNWKYRNV